MDSEWKKAHPDDDRPEAGMFSDSRTGKAGTDADTVSHDLADFAEKLGIEVVADAAEVAPSEADTGDMVAQREHTSADVEFDPSEMTSEKLKWLFDESGGHFSLARTVIDVLSEASLPKDLSLTGFADYVASLTPTLDLRVSAGDRRAAAALSNLSSFSKQTALRVVTALPLAVEQVARDAESILLNLRMAGIITAAPTATKFSGVSDGSRLRIPGLLAAKLRYELVDDPNRATITERMIEALVDQLESAQSIDSTLLADVLALARRTGRWSALLKLQESFGLPIFLLAPETSCAVLARLPVEGLEAEPDLGFFSRIAEQLIERTPDEINESTVRAALVDLTDPEQMRENFPPADSVPGGGEAAAGGADYFEVLRHIVDLASNGRHSEAAEVGLAWTARSKGRRSRLVISFVTAVSFFHAAQPHRALSILHEIEPFVEEDHVRGDFLMPAVFAWSALVGTFSGDHEKANEYLARMDDYEWYPSTLDALVSPVIRIARAQRALDRLDLDVARANYEQLLSHPGHRSLWGFLPALGRTIALLSETTVSELLFVSDEVERSHADAASSLIGHELLRGSRGMVYIALGQLRWAELEIERMSPNSNPRIVLSARIELVAGRNHSAISVVDAWFYHQSLTPVSRAELAALKAAALLRDGRRSEAAAGFTTALGLCSWVGTLLPLVFLPQTDRSELVDLTRDSNVWDELYSAFAGSAPDRAAFIGHLLRPGAILVRQASLPQLSAAEAQLLSFIAEGLSIAQISREMNQATGTVKNRLSALYRKFGVSNKSEVIVRARSLGFLFPQ